MQQFGIGNETQGKKPNKHEQINKQKSDYWYTVFIDIKINSTLLCTGEQKGIQ